MHKLIITLALLFSLSISAKSSQIDSPSDSLKKSNNKTYKLSWKADVPVLAVAFTGVYLGGAMRAGKEPLDPATTLALDPNTLSKFNRHATKQKDEIADPISDGIFIGGILVPLTLFLDGKVRQNAGEVAVMYIQAMALSGMGYTLAAGLSNKRRPYAYNKEFSFEQRNSINSTYSFYSGHPSMVATGTFFAATVFSQLHPDNNFKYVAFAGATAATLTCAYYRYRGGYHFVTDLATGVGIGAAIGILVPVLHKIKTKKGDLTISPALGIQNGLALTYKL